MPRRNHETPAEACAALRAWWGEEHPQSARMENGRPYPGHPKSNEAMLPWIQWIQHEPKALRAVIETGRLGISEARLREADEERRRVTFLARRCGLIPK